ncbi:MAG TPA: HigA family addiction module antitoxin [Clostridia bacterium]|jgi:HTH-type transcriptional regulator/antitoxin HigA|nr:HigA family addiction module antitoxin [Clostridia bacterium]
MSKPTYAIHPGVFIRKYLKMDNLRQSDLAEKTGIHRSMLNEIINGKRSITLNTAYNLEKAFDFPATYWIELQARYDKRIQELASPTQISAGYFVTEDPGSDASVHTTKVLPAEQ